MYWAVDPYRPKHDQDKQDDHQDQHQRGWDRVYPAIDAPQKAIDDHQPKRGETQDHQDRLAE